MQPPRSTVILQPQPRSGVSWFMPKLCPSSCAKVTAAPSGFSEWSCDGKKKGTLDCDNVLIVCNLVCSKMHEIQSKSLKQALRKNQAILKHTVT